MKIRQYIVTYDNAPMLHRCLESIFDGLSEEETRDLELYIINNHSRFELDDRFTNRVTVLHNTLRPDFSTGHLARNWNQALIHGFENLQNPACDIVITTQNDAMFKPHYVTTVCRLHQTYDFIQYGIEGDAVISYTPTAVKRIGLWDERFCNIGYQEVDYFYRAIRYHPEKTCLHNPGAVWPFHTLSDPDRDDITVLVNTGYGRGDPHHLRSLAYHNVSQHLLHHKWPNGAGGDPVSSYIMYPYFERDVETLRQQNYIIPYNFPSDEMSAAHAYRPAHP